MIDIKLRALNKVSVNAKTYINTRYNFKTIIVTVYSRIANIIIAKVKAIC